MSSDGTKWAGVILVYHEKTKMQLCDFTDKKTAYRSRGNSLLNLINMQQFAMEYHLHLTLMGMLVWASSSAFRCGLPSSDKYS